MATSTRSVSRGDYVFAVTVTRELRPVVISADGDMVTTGKIELYAQTQIQVTKGGKLVECGALEVFSDAYKASASYKKTFQKFPAAPSARLGDMWLSADATALLEQAVAEATTEVTTPEIAAHIQARKDAVAANMQAEREHEAHVNAVESMMTLGGKST